MDSRERLRRAYAHEEMDRPGVYSRTGYPDADPTYRRLKALLAARSELKVPWQGRTCESRPATRTVTEPLSADWDRQVTVLETPLGPLRSSWRVSRRVMAGFLALGADVLHPFDGPAMCDITPAEASQAAGEVCFPQYEALVDEVLAGRG